MQVHPSTERLTRIMERTRLLVMAWGTLQGAVPFIIQAPPWRRAAALAGSGLLVTSMLVQIGVARRRRVPFWVFAATLNAFMVYVMLLSGGLLSPMRAAMALMPVAAVCLMGRGRAAAWFVGAGVAVPLAVAALHSAVDLPALAPLLHRSPMPGHALVTGVTALALCVATAVCGLVGRALQLELAEARDLRSVAAAEQQRTEKEREAQLRELTEAVAHVVDQQLAGVEKRLAAWRVNLPPDHRHAQRLQVMSREAARMRTLLGDYERLARGPRANELMKTDVGALVNELLAAHEGTAAARRVTLATSTPAVAELTTDPQRLRQVLGNLLLNALDAAPPDSTVEVLVEPPQGGMRIHVLDRGPGVAESVRGRLFTPGATTKDHGSGLGLYVARGLLEPLGGTLELRGREGGGCRAVVTLPLEGAGP